ncbi:MAG: hypothetical protein ABW221_08025 [Vicinamibacteria bacterium]
MTRDDRWLVGGALVLAAALRLFALGAAPLDAGEAAHAWRALRLATAGDASAAGLTSACAAAAQALVFSFLGAGDALARLPSAAFGIALVLVPALVWPALGRARGLGLCLLLACEPGLVAWSRRATGEAAAALGAALVAVCLLRWTAAATRRAEDARAAAIAASAAAGFLLTTGPAAWSLLPPLGFAAWRLRPWEAAEVRPGRLLAAAAVAALGCSTAAFFAIPWASAVSASLTAALAGGGALASFAALPSAAVLLAAVGLAGSPRRLAHAGTIAWGAAVTAASPHGLVALTLACTACAADGVGALAAARGRARVRLALVALLAAAVLAGRMSTPAPPPEDRALRALAADVRETAVERGHAANEMPVVVVQDPPDAEVAWALRDVRSLDWASAPPAPRPVAPLLVAPADATGTPGAYERRVYGPGPRAVSLWVPRAR